MASPLSPLGVLRAALASAITTPALTGRGISARATPAVEVPASPGDARAPVRETGYVLPTGVGGGNGSTQPWWFTDPLLLEDGPDLAWPGSVRTFDRMRRSDSQVASVLRAVTLPVLRTDWSLDPNGADDDVVAHCAQDLDLPILGGDAEQLPARRGRGRFSFAVHLSEALDFLHQGHAFFEQLYRIDEDGRARLRKLAARPATTLASIDVAPDGGLVSITQQAPAGSTEPTGPRIPVSRLVAYVNGGGPGNWRGESVLRSAYKDWWLKDQLLRIDTEGIARNSMGVPQYEASEEGGQAEIVEGRKLAQAYRAANAGGAAFPHGAALRLKGVEGQLREAMARIEYHDRQIARAVLAHYLNLNAQGGSYALAAVQADTFTQSLQTVAQLIADVLTQHVVEDLVDLNYGPDARAPRVVFADIGSQQAATAQAITLLVDRGVLTADDELEAAVRRTYRLPAKALGATARSALEQTAETAEQPPAAPEQEQ